MGHELPKISGGFMNKRIFLTITSFAICFVLFGNVSAQVRGNYSRRDVNTTIRSLETSSDVFSRDFKRFSAQSRYSNGRDDRFVQVVDRFENAVDSLRRNFDRSNDWWSSRNDVQSIMGEAQNVKQMMNELRFARDLEVQWRNMRRDINALARTFSLPTLEGTGGNANPGVGYSNGGGYSGSGYPNGGYSGSGNGGGNWATVRPPSWAVGTFYGQ